MVATFDENAVGTRSGLALLVVLVVLVVVVCVVVGPVEVVPAVVVVVVVPPTHVQSPVHVPGGGQPDVSSHSSSAGSYTPSPQNDFVAVYAFRTLARFALKMPVIV